MKEHSPSNANIESPVALLARMKNSGSQEERLEIWGLLVERKDLGLSHLKWAMIHAPDEDVRVDAERRFNKTNRQDTRRTARVIEAMVVHSKPGD
ncbi:MAG: hypothetical protein WC640_03210 [Candidatus Paceibacterota bacterium]|jgi:hypothetical protein